ncbi:MAG TPA: T9SS type A sorting domain-containing protein, partial [Rubricoccaceae bacterium]
ESYPFESAATGWTDRFELVLASNTTAGEPVSDAPFALGVPVPNPASGVSRLRLQAAASGRVTATVVDALGRTVAVAFDREVAAGTSVEIAVDAAALAPGTYAVRVAGPGAAETRRLVVVR